MLDQVWSDYGTPGVLGEYSYTFDRVGNRTSRGNVLETDLSQAFDDDGLDQLISADRTNGYTLDWELDGRGNWTRKRFASPLIFP